MEQALWITVIGMGGVFAFLCLLIASMGALKWVTEDTNKHDKIAVAIAVARAQEN